MRRRPRRREATACPFPEPSKECAAANHGIPAPGDVGKGTSKWCGHARTNDQGGHCAHERCTDELSTVELARGSLQARQPGLGKLQFIDAEHGECQDGQQHGEAGEDPWRLEKRGQARR
jgi:hypothetical protein